MKFDINFAITDSDKKIILLYERNANQLRYESFLIMTKMSFEVRSKDIWLGGGGGGGCEGKIYGESEIKIKTGMTVRKEQDKKIVNHVRWQNRENEKFPKRERLF